MFVSSKLAFTRENTGRKVRARIVVAVVALVTAAAGVMVVGADESAQADESVFVFGGSGWGHGIGLSQYGAYGQALEGRSAEDILHHYYTGVALETVDQLVASGDVSSTHPIVTDATPIWVGLAQNSTVLSFTPVGGDVRFCQAFETETRCLNVGSDDAGSSETWTLAQASNGGVLGCVLTRSQPPLDPPDPQPLGLGTCRASVEWGDAGQASRVAINGASCAASTGWERNCFSHGSLRVRSDAVSTGFHVALELGLEEYLYGVGEMPSSWPAAALEAQAVAARTYAVHRLLGNEQPSLATENDAGFSDARKAACWCHIYSTVKDQNFVGYSKEAAASGSLWVAAVNATAREVITHPSTSAAYGSVVIAFYHSSSGGVTETNESVWGTSLLPYLKSVDDAWSNSAAVANPYESWTVSVGASVLAGILGWDSVTDVVLESGAPAASFRFAGQEGGIAVSSVVSSATLYVELGTRSPHFDSVRVQSHLPFDDIEESPHVDEIVALAEAGLTSGCDGRLFCPDGELTRAQMATFLAGALGLAPVADAQFVDSHASPAHAPNINAIAVVGITVGCNADGTEFCPEDVVSRGQMASFLARALDLAPVVEGSFVDVPPGSNHSAAINAVAAAGISLGCVADGTEFCPDDVVTRGQMAAFLVRAFVDT